MSQKSEPDPTNTTTDSNPNREKPKRFGWLTDERLKGLGVIFGIIVGIFTIISVIFGIIVVIVPMIPLDDDDPDPTPPPPPPPECMQIAWTFPFSQLEGVVVPTIEWDDNDTMFIGLGATGEESFPGVVAEVTGDSLAFLKGLGAGNEVRQILIQNDYYYFVSSNQTIQKYNITSTQAVDITPDVGIPFSAVSYIAASQDDMLYIALEFNDATNPFSIYSSTDGGSSWQRVITSIQAGFETIRFLHYFRDKLYVASRNGLFILSNLDEDQPEVEEQLFVGDVINSTAIFGNNLIISHGGDISILSTEDNTIIPLLMGDDRLAYLHVLQESDTLVAFHPPSSQVITLTIGEDFQVENTCWHSNTGMLGTELQFIITGRVDPSNPRIFWVGTPEGIFRGELVKSD